MTQQQYYYRPEPSKKNTRPAHSARTVHKGRRRVTIIGAALAAVIVLGAIGVYGYARIKFAEIRKLAVGSLDTAGANQPINILLVGNNSRSVLNGKQANAFGSGSQVGGARSDVTMIAHLDPKTRTVTLVSIPRDLFLPIPGSTNLNRVDSALNYGPSTLVKTIEQDLGIPINHYIELNFDTFQSVVTALGGINMYFPYHLKDAYSGLNITQTGCLHLNGFQALAVVRARHLQYSPNGVTWYYDPLGDLSRIRRDHEFLRVLASEVKAKGASNPVTLNSVLSAIEPYLGLDKSFTFNELVSLATTYRHTNPNSIKTATLPVALENNYFYLGANYGDVVFAAQPQDWSILQQYMGMQTPPIARSSITLSVANGTGAYMQATDVATALQKLGYKIASVGNTAIQGSNLETVVRYTPGHLAMAEKVMSDLSGAVVMSQGATTGGAPVEVITGNGLSVATLARPAAQATQANSLTSAPGTQATKASSQTSAASTTSVNNPITLPATSSNMPLQPWDPRACPA
ncbi:MAG: LCP family protein [Actinomycetota bacterium]|nr:LCP family protein [Actinomycetota bacterium]